MDQTIEGAFAAYLRETLLPLDEEQLVQILDRCAGDSGEVPELVQRVVNEVLAFYGGLHLAVELGDLREGDDT